MATKKQSNTQELGFEEKIWKAADSMRGHIDASEYKNVVLGLIFLKYISDRFEQRHQELVDEGEGFEEDRDEYSFENIFWVPRGARWEEIAKAAHTPEIGKVIDEAMREIEAENKKLKGILPKNFACQELDKRMLGDVVDLFTNVKMAGEDGTQDVLGRTYEYCLAKFAEQEGKNAGEFYTPTCIVKTLVEIIEPYHGRVYEYMQAAHWNTSIFTSKTGLDAMHYTRVQKPDHKFTLKPLIAMGVGLELDISEMEEVLTLAGLSFSPTNRDEQAYKYLFTGMYRSSIDECNEFLEKIDVPLLGTRQRM